MAAAAAVAAAARTVPARAQPLNRALRQAAPLPSAPALNPDAPMDVRAGRIEYDTERRVVVGRDGVVVAVEGQMLRADYMEVNTATGDVLARGNVILTRADGSSWRGDTLTYNVRTQVGDFGRFVYRTGPYFVHALESAQTSPRLIRLRGVVVTTCDQPEPREFEITAAEATIEDQRYLRARHAAAWLGPVPFFYSPYLRRDLQSEGRWDIEPGYTSRLGPLLLIAYNYPLNDANTFKGATQLNLYSESGAGIEQRFQWRAPGDAVRGDAGAFFIQDRRPFRDDAERAEREAALTSDNRYRLRLNHTQALAPDVSFFAGGAFLSDPYVVKDFFRGEYRRQPTPENRAGIVHAAPDYTLSVLLNRRLNDFYTNVDRLPEVRLAVPALPLGDSGFYFENETAAARLERVFPEGDANADYDAVRLDTANRISYPGRYFGFLAFTPRVGWRGTYYSKTRGPPVSVTNTVAAVENGVATNRTEVVTTYPQEGGALRNVFEAGFDTSFKAFKVLDEGENQWGRGLRHVAEPYVRHTFVPEPNRTPDRLYPFDEIDTLDEVHQVRLGLRNKLQTRRGGREVHDLLDADLSTAYRVVAPEGESAFGTYDANVRLRPGDAFALDLDARYDADASEFAEFNARVVAVAGDRSRWNLEYRYRPDERNAVNSEIALFPKAPWSFGLQHRVDLDEGRLEEHGYSIQRRMSCITWSVGVSHEPAYADGEKDDYRVWVRLWLNALPGRALDLGG